MRKLVLIGLGLVTGLFAIQDGVYHCIATKVVDLKTNIAIKLKNPTGIFFNVKQNGMIVTTKKDFLQYAYTLKNYDAFMQKGSDYTLLLPTNSVKKYFGAGLVQGDKEILMACEKVK